MSKGSWRRPQDEDDAVVEARWEAIFGRTKFEKFDGSPIAASITATKHGTDAETITMEGTNDEQ